MGFGLKNFWKGLRLVPNSSNTTSQKGDLQVTNSDSLLNYHNGSNSAAVVTTTHPNQGANRLQNKDLADSNVAIVDNSDTTKKILFDAAGTSGTTTTLLSSQTANRVLTLPDSTGTLSTTSGSETISNKTFVSDTMDVSLNTVTNIADTNISASAAITRSKLANGTAYRILANDSSGVISENAALTSNQVVIVDANGQLTGEANLAISRGGTNSGTASGAFNNLSPLTTKGDVLGYSTVNARIPVGANNTVLTADSTQALGVKWASPGAGTIPTQQVFNSPGAGTYTTPASVLYLRVRMVGGGGGGGGSGSGAGTGTDGTQSSFSTSAASFGTKGGTDGGTGGTASINVPAYGSMWNGGSGTGTPSEAAASINLAGGNGGNSSFGGGGGGGSQGADGRTAGANTGAGGGGAGLTAVGGSNRSGGGGGAGATVDMIVPSPAASYSYTVGSKGTGGAAGTSGNIGGDGADGYIEVTEYYQ